MIKAKVKNIKPLTRFIDERNNKYYVFMEEMQDTIGLVLDFDECKGEEYRLSRSPYNESIIKDEFHFMLEYCSEWLQPLTKEIKLSKLNIPIWIENIINSNIL